MPSLTFDVAAPVTHTMGLSLRAYIAQHIHSDLQNQTIARIVVTGSSQRYTQFGNAAIDSLRPTVSWTDPATIRLTCLPSRNLMRHYAGIVATYLRLCGRDPGIVHLSLPDPDETGRLIRESNLRAIGHVDLAIIGSVNNLTGLAGLTDDWQGADGSEDSMFRWQTMVSSRGQTAALIGCLEQLWGETGEHLLRALFTYLNVKCVIYTAKCGSVSKEYTANEWIATGSQAILEGEVIQWPNPLDGVLDVSRRVARGSIVTVPTPLCETQEWLSEWSPKVSWVDCEVGFMAKAAVDLGVEFGYLHVVSDNLCQNAGDNLSNEDSDVVSGKRKVLYDEICKILDALLFSKEMRGREANLLEI
ncbi:hypothetical protein F5Y14DRAFT_399003 [Nemania sp. NC0429]|nr:hypothetical protein F5Y14DRAFT_399003 [Nemania sp. NC0429]